MSQNVRNVPRQMTDGLDRHLSLLRQYGPRRCLFRLAYDLRRKHGLLKRRLAAWRWQDRPLSNWLKPGRPAEPEQFRRDHQREAGRFFFALGEPPSPSQEWVTGALNEVDSLRQGRMRYFGALAEPMGFPEVDWFLNPFTGRRDSAEQHWCERGDFLPQRGDIKYIWEPARFSWAYSLVRAYGAGRSDDVAEMFWLAFESWLAANPPQMGPNWQCGQEIAIRVMACVFAMHAFWKSPAATSQRIAAMVVFLAASAQRIAANINYARSQMSNHAATEAAGLYTVGLLLPELAGSARWRKVGRDVLEDEASRLNWSDGSYAQHSMNYQRLMLQDYLWCLRLGELNGEAFSGRLRKRLASSYGFLHELQDAATGRVPNYGPNDGALVLPLNSCDYLDYRPVIGAMHFLFERERLYDTTPASEDLLWLFGPAALEAPVRSVKRRGRSLPAGGYFTLRGQDAWAMVRCHSYRNRPNQADMLHVDLWWHGLNVLHDAGSFSYYDPQQGWNDYFTSTAAHNTVVVGGADQMVKGPRFQWFRLVKSRFIGRTSRGHMELWQGEHYGYRRLASRATHRRTICRCGEGLWLVVDDILGEGSEKAQLFWHLADGVCRMDGRTVRLCADGREVGLSVLSSTGDAEYRLERGLADKERMGWQSLYYGVRAPCWTLCVQTAGELPVRFVTLISLGRQVQVTADDVNAEIAWSEHAGAEADRVELAPAGDSNLVVRTMESAGGPKWSPTPRLRKRRR